MGRKSQRAFRRLCAAAAAALLAASGGHTAAGVLVEWDTNALLGIQGGGGGWTSGTNWNDAGTRRAWVGANGDTAVFSGTPGGTVTLSSTVTAAAVRFDAPGFTIGAAASPALTLASGSVIANVNATIFAALAAPAGVGLYKSGAGTLTLSGTNTLQGPLRVLAGTLAFASDPNLGPAANDIHLSGGALRYTASSDLTLNSNREVVVDAAGGAIDLPAGDLFMGTASRLSGAGTLTKLGAARLRILAANANFTGTVTVSEGTLSVDHPQAINGRPVTLTGGKVAFRTDVAAAPFGSDVTASADAELEVDVGGPQGAINEVQEIRDLAVAPAATLTLRAGRRVQLAVRDLSVAGAMVIDDAGLRVTGAVSGGGAIRFGPQTRPADVFEYGLIFESGGAVTLPNPIALEPAADARAFVAVGAATGVTYQGAWDAGRGGTAASFVALRGGSTFTAGNLAHLNTTTPDLATARPLIVLAAGTNDAFVLAPGFVADRTAAGTIADGFSALDVRGATLRTHATASLPVAARPDGVGGTHRAGTLLFSGTTAARWEVAGAAQAYDARVTIDAPTTIRTDADLTHTGITSSRFDGQFQIPTAGVTLIKDGPAALTLAGAQGYAPGTTMQVSAGVVRFDTDPGGGWYDGNFARGGDGHVVAAPTPAATLAIAAASGAAADFAAPVSRVASLLVGSGGAARVIPSPVDGARTLVTHALSITGSGRVDLTNHRLVVEYDAAAPSPLATIAGWVLSGRGTPAALWQGAGITSSAAAADPTRGVGFGEASEVLRLTPGQTGSFGGHVVDATSVLARYTLLGDANLDGVVDFSDFQRFERGFGRTGQSWVSGDFDYNQIVDSDDFMLLYRNFDRGPNSVGAETLDAFAATVPEPPVASIIACALALGIRRRKQLITH